MKNNRRRPTSLFEMLFLSNFNDSLFSFEHPSYNSNFLKSEDNFPEKDDPNFNYTEETIESASHVTKKEIWTSIDGSQKLERVTSNSKLKSANTLKEPTKEDLKLLLQKAIDDQRFEDAVKLRDDIKRLEAK